MHSTISDCIPRPLLSWLLTAVLFCFASPVSVASPRDTLSAKAPQVAVTINNDLTARDCPPPPIQTPPRWIDGATKWASVIYPAFMIAAVLATAVMQLLFGLRLKQADVHADLERQYDRIMEKLRSSDGDTKNQVYSDFWELQLRQYELWRKGLLRGETFEAWMNSRRSQWRKALEEATPSTPPNDPPLILGYQEFTNRLDPSASFRLLMKRITGSADDIESILKPEAPGYWERFWKLLQI